MADINSDVTEGWERLQQVLSRAQRAIERAKCLTERLGAEPAAEDRSLGDTEGRGVSSQQHAPLLEPTAAGTEQQGSFARQSSSLTQELEASGQDNSTAHTTCPAHPRHAVPDIPSAGGQPSNVPPGTSHSSLDYLARACYPPPTLPAWLRLAHTLPRFQSASERLQHTASGAQHSNDSPRALPHHQTAQGSSTEPSAAAPKPQTATPDTSASSAAVSEAATEPSDAPATPPLQAVSPLIAVARRLSMLQQQQSSTLSQLLGLRLEQLRLRQQQLTALQELLRAESASVEGTALQISAVDQALSLLSQSLSDMDDAADAITRHGGDSSSAEVQVLAATVSAADQRAEDISRMARQLLNVLREYPRRRSLDSGPQTAGGTVGTPPGGGEWGQGRQVRSLIRGATEWEMSCLPSTVCNASHPQHGETCAICLSSFLPDDTLVTLPCFHWLHKQCVEPWLRIKACCPLCKLPLPGATVRVLVDTVRPPQVLMDTPTDLDLDVAIHSAPEGVIAATDASSATAESGIMQSVTVFVEAEGRVGAEQQEVAGASGDAQGAADSPLQGGVLGVPGGVRGLRTEYSSSGVMQHPHAREE